ncbi:hypothetical protein BSLG_009878 [Batrachochytrium salamandrivorans]|nr:hypothetical protein BSLG_009878 [Batrachochytrium salamandrivorans]
MQTSSSSTAAGSDGLYGADASQKQKNQLNNQQEWTPDSWRSKSVHQDVLYEDSAHLNKVLQRLGQLPPLVSPGEVDRLKALLKEVAEGKRFLLQGGDCAELFDYCSKDPIQNKLKVLLQMSLILVWGGRTKVLESTAQGMESRHVQNPDIRKEYQDIVDHLHDALDFMQTIGADNDPSARTIDLFMSHEGISNPIGVKVGPSMRPEELGPLLDILNPRREVGKVTLITRYGADKVGEFLPAHIQAVRESGHCVVWCCDPMHGNTESTANGVKTRRFDHIVKELGEAFSIHQRCGSYLGGVHCELTGDPVTETIGGSMNLIEEDLGNNYQTYCDPRLNYFQSLDVAFMIAKLFKKQWPGNSQE